jgi:predicted protein tyrosine phosphatase
MAFREAVEGDMQHVLFVCSRNRLRSPTAERVFACHRGVEVASAGLSPDADDPLTPELLEWADLIFVMEEAHRVKLATRFRRWLGGKRVVCLGISDEYGLMDPELIELLVQRVSPFLSQQ